jgi:hypothetical protein
MIVKLFFYDTSGRITMVGACPESMVPLQEGDHYQGEMDPSTEYIVDGKPAPRPTCPAALSGFTLSGMPVPSQLFINDVAHDVTEASVDLEFPQPGKYDLRVVAWPYLDGRFTVTV